MYCVIQKSQKPACYLIYHVIAHFSLIDVAFADSKCGNGVCESPFEYPGFGRFGCEADCGKYKKTSRIMLDFGNVEQASAEQGWDWSKVDRTAHPSFSYNIFSDTMGDWLFEQVFIKT
jgi:hypothetical protein